MKNPITLYLLILLISIVSCDSDNQNEEVIYLEDVINSEQTTTDIQLTDGQYRDDSNSIEIELDTSSNNSLTKGTYTVTVLDAQGE
jgi:hypothetical protein